jgi:hypothetical protein
MFSSEQGINRDSPSLIRQTARTAGGITISYKIIHECDYLMAAPNKFFTIADFDRFKSNLAIVAGLVPPTTRERWLVVQYDREPL